MRAVEKRLRARIKELEQELEEVREDRDRFRNDVVGNLKYALSVLGEGKYWNMQNLVEVLAKQIARKQVWYW